MHQVCHREWGEKVRQSDSAMSCWGRNETGQTDIPVDFSGVPITSVSSGSQEHTGKQPLSKGERPPAE